MAPDGRRTGKRGTEGRAIGVAGVALVLVGVAGAAVLAWLVRPGPPTSAPIAPVGTAMEPDAAPPPVAEPKPAAPPPVGAARPGAPPPVREATASEEAPPSSEQPERAPLLGPDGEPTRALLRNALSAAIARHDPSLKLSSDELEAATAALWRLREARLELARLGDDPAHARRRAALVEAIGEATADFTYYVEMSPAELTALDREPDLRGAPPPTIERGAPPPTVER